MKDLDKPFEITKTFGLGVLLKLTKTNIGGIEIEERQGKLTANVSTGELIKAVNATIEGHNIRLQVL
ncbi:hypothetical protein [Desulfospira joergensenii]|uniref:hypothetical protein n=1 Tax=Desulfospira joergensenii TaxID=53329 RepID=UPI0003B7552E|nr:hypothetical protein [Desulfospira joergensenii]